MPKTLLPQDKREAVATMSLNAVNVRRRELSAELKRIDALDDDAFSAESDNYLMLTEEDSLLAARHDSLMAANEARLKRRQAAGETDPDGAVAEMNGGGNGKIGKIKDGFLEDPKRGFESRADLLHNVRDLHLRRGKQANGPDPRLRSLMAVGDDEHATWDDPTVGIMIPKTMLPGIEMLDPEEDQFAGLTRKVPMATRDVELVARNDKNHQDSVTGGFVVTRRGEAQTGRSSRTSLEKIKLTAQSMFGLAYLTEEAIEDADTSFVSLIGQMFPDEFKSRVLYERIHGQYGQGEYEGFLNTACKIEVAKETGQAPASIVGENILNMRSRIWGYDKAVWVANHDCFPQLYKLYIAAGTTGVITFYNTSLKEDGSGTLLGRPIIFTEYANTLGTAGDLSLVNWSEFLEGIYKPFQSASSIHVRFETHERCFKFWQRNCGRWWWRTVFTPKKGANTLSPVVTLATRA